MLKAAVGYVRKNPDEVVRQAVNATGLTFGVPLATLRWFAGNLKGKKAPKDVEITSAPPALRFSAVVDAMGTPVRAAAAIKIDEITISPEQVRIGVRVRDVKLSLAGPSESPVATLIQSGALDLSKPGNLVKFIPKKPPAIVEAEGDRIVIDLMKVPKLANDPRVKKILSIISPVLGIRAIETDRDHLWIKLRATPAGLPEALGKLRAVR
ncbi:MAG: hypothetical protein JST00_35475 [Deltaproteobacteria bacterium]|nr:hypothetical protein [Deltaproteobacteria bacterium]